MRTNLNSTSMRNTCPEFPLFGAKVIIYQFTPPYKKIDKSHFY